MECGQRDASEAPSHCRAERASVALAAQEGRTAHAQDQPKRRNVIVASPEVRDMAEQSHAGSREANRAAAEEDTAAALAMLRRSVPEGMEQLIPLVYDELRRVAHWQLAGEPAGHTLSTTALVHEAYRRLSEQKRVEWTSRGQFFGLAARAMRRVLVDYARRHGAAQRGGPGLRRLSLDDPESGAGEALAVAARGDELLALDEALDRLSTVDARLAHVVECRFFGGLTEVETAEVLGVSQRTVAGDWLMAKGWLYRALRPDDA